MVEMDREGLALLPDGAVVFDWQGGLCHPGRQGAALVIFGATVLR